MSPENTHKFIGIYVDSEGLIPAWCYTWYMVSASLTLYVLGFEKRAHFAQNYDFRYGL